MSQTKLSKADFDNIVNVVGKKLRNKRKKLEKINQTHAKIINKEIEPTEEQKEMIASKDKVESQVKELEEMKRQLRAESNKVLDKHVAIIKNLDPGDVDPHEAIDRVLATIIDLGISNLLANHYEVDALFSDETKSGSDALVAALRQLIEVNPTVNYEDLKVSLLQTFSSYVRESTDTIPGTDTTFAAVNRDISEIPDSVRTNEFHLKTESAPVEEEKVEETKETAPAETDQPEAKPDMWNERDDDDDDEDDENDEKDKWLASDEDNQVIEGDPELLNPDEKQVIEETKKSMMKGKRDFHKNKNFVDDDGFIHQKPHSRPDHEHKYLKGRGRKGRGRKGRRGETDRFRVRGGKGQGRGGRGGTDKHETDEHGNKIKYAHGSNPHWKKGEVRTQQNLD